LNKPKCPSVSVIIPTYNRARLVSRAIQSVLNQTYQNLELIVIDDASTDNTEEVVKDFKDNRIRYICHDENKGGATARNTGIKTAKGKYIAFLDSDDEWLSEKLEKQFNLLQGLPESVGVVYSLYFSKDDEIGLIKRVDFETYKGNVFRHLLEGWCPSITSAALLTLRCLQKSGMFDENLPSFQDYDLWLRVAQNYHFDFIHEPLVINHQHAGSRVASDYNPRIRGLELFLKKWSPIIKGEVGDRSFREIRRKHLSTIYSKAILDSLLASQRKDAFKYLNKLIGIRGVSLKLLAKMLIVLIGGARLFYFTKSITYNRSFRMW